MSEYKIQSQIIASEVEITTKLNGWIFVVSQKEEPNVQSVIVSVEEEANVR